MGMTYDDLSLFGKLRLIQRCGPFGMFCKLAEIWKGSLSLEQVRTFDSKKKKKYKKAIFENKNSFLLLLLDL